MTLQPKLHGAMARMRSRSGIEPRLLSALKLGLSGQEGSDRFRFEIGLGKSFQSRIGRVTTTVFVIVGFLLGARAATAPREVVDYDRLKTDFRSPPMEMRPRAIYLIPRVEWDIPKLAKDLDFMRDVGMGGAWYHDGYEGFGSVFGNFSYFPEQPGAPYMSPGHLKKLNLFLEEAAKRSLKIVAPIRAMYMSGGPWIDQEHAAKDYTLSKVYFSTPGKIRVTLPLPASRDADGVEDEAKKKFYRDAFVVAWPVKQDPRTTLVHRLKPKISVNNLEVAAEVAYLSDGNPISLMNLRGTWLLPYGPRPAQMPKETVVTYEFPRAVELASCFIALTPDKSVFPIRAQISASTDGKVFRKLADLTIQVGQSAQAKFASVSAQWFRVTFPPLTNRNTVGVGEIELLAPGEDPSARGQIHDFNLKSARVCWDDNLATDPADFYGSRRFYDPLPNSPSTGIRRSEVRDLTANMNADGVLEWEVPSGTWCVMRFGYTIAKQGYVGARPGGEGYECDIYDAAAARIQYENVPHRIWRNLTPEGKKGLQGFWFTGFELGPTNWTPKMAEEFKARAGYDLLTWLPALGDEIVENAERTDAFLADFRHTLYWLFAERHHQVMKTLATADGLEFFSKTGVSKQANQDALLYLSRSHVPSGESPGGSDRTGLGYDNILYPPFGGKAIKGPHLWWTTDAQIKLPASVSHTYNNSQIVAGSAGEGRGDHYFDHVPAMDKHAIDRAFCMGMNQNYDGVTHDPRPDVLPGLHHWPWLTPRNTLSSEASAFYSYLAKCQTLLQRGRFQADVLITEEDAFHLVGRAASQTSPKVYVPKGYDFDFLSRELFLADLRVEGGKLKLSSGMSYRVLEIPEFANRSSVAGLKKLEALLQAGAIVVAPRPIAGITESDYADGLQEHGELTERLWRGLDGKTTTSKSYGRGRLYWGATLEEVLQKERIQPDFSYSEVDADVDYIHRRIDETGIDFYFVANPVNRLAEVKARFRGQAGKTPHRFDPLTGEISQISGTDSGQDQEIALKLEPVGSQFIVFTAEKPRKLPTGAAIPTGISSRTISGPWQVEFRDMFGESFHREFPQLESFSQSEDKKVEYFSGSATYRQHFNLPPEAKSQRVELECGNVRWLAGVHVNGQKAGIVWCPPWRLDISSYCQPGENNLEIICVNPWKNRLIGDSLLPENERKTVITNFRVNIDEFKKMKPMEAGLLGPVQLRFSAASPE